MYYDFQKLKETARGLWPTIHTHVLGYALTIKHGPCAIHEGTDKSRGFHDYVQEGGGICTGCGPMADGFEVIRVHKGCSFPEAIKLVADYLGIKPSKSDRTPSKESIDPTKNLDFSDTFPEQLAAIWSLGKKPIDPKVLPLVKARFAQYRKRNPVFALPAIGKDGKAAGWCLYHATNKGLPIFEKGNREPIEFRKIKNTSGSEAGWIGPPSKDTDEIIWKLEGPSDMLALLTLGLPSNHNACTNLFGCGENPASNPWMLDRFKGKTVYVLHDCDEPGQAGAIEATNGTRKRPGWAPAIASVAKECRNVVLPYPIEKTHGKDLRDWVNDRLGEGLTKPEIFQRLLEIAKRSTVIQGQAIATTGSAESSSLDVSQFEAERIDDPHRLARINLHHYEQTHGRFIRYWKQTWFTWKEGRYEEISTDHFELRINGACQEEFERAWRNEMKAYIQWLKSDDYSKEKDKGQPKKRIVTTTLVKNVIQATKSMRTLRDSQELHSWCDGHDEGFCIAVENGILNISKAVSSNNPPPTRDEILLPHTPNWFSTNKLDFAFDEHAQCPTWTNFLAEIFNGDKDSIELIQKWFGYLLTPDNSLQKILFVIGQPRSGKGTILHVMNKLFGSANITMPKLNNFQSQFALHSMLGKTIAIIADARLSERADETTITEHLLSISGGDPQDIQRKYKDTLTSFPLNVRFTLFSNMLPRMKDASAAFLSRCVFLRMPNSYLGREDLTLRDRLLEELPGILNWSIYGHHMLTKNPRLKQPAMASNLVDEMRSIVSPHSDFINSACLVGPEHHCDTKELFVKWEQWCVQNDISNPGNIQSFSRRLHNINPEIETQRVRIGGSECRRFKGLTWKEEAF